MHEAGFAHWPGQIDPATRSYEVTSSMDVVPTVSALIGAALPTDRVYDGRDMSDIIFNTNGGKVGHPMQCIAVHDQSDSPITTYPSYFHI